MVFEAGVLGAGKFHGAGPALEDALHLVMVGASGEDLGVEVGSGVGGEAAEEVLEELGLDRRNPFVLALINGLKEKNKPIGFDEFIDIIASRVGETKTKDGLRRVFALFDKDENGVLDFEEFKGIAKQLHDAVNDDDLLEMLHSTHVNHKTASNEGITFEEFYSVVSKFANK